jgi:hypothetical protein
MQRRVRYLRSLENWFTVYGLPEHIPIFAELKGEI